MALTTGNRTTELSLKLWIKRKRKKKNLRNFRISTTKKVKNGRLRTNSPVKKPVESTS